MRPKYSLPPRVVHPPAPAGSLIGWLVLAIVWIFLLMFIGVRSGYFSLSPTTWYIARSSGFALFGLSWVVMVSGLANTTKLLDSVWARHLQYSIHTYAFQLWCGFLLLHVLSLLFDPTVSIGLGNVLVPWMSGIRQPWTGMGVLAAEIMIVIGGSAWLRRWLGYTVWRALHWLSFPVFVLGLIHGVGGGTDTTSLPATVLYVLAGSTVVLMAIYRAIRGKARQQDRLSRLSPEASTMVVTGKAMGRDRDRFGSVERTRSDAASHR